MSWKLLSALRFTEIFFEKDLWKNPDAYQACLDQFEKTYKNPFRGNSGNTPFWFSGSEEEKQSWINEQELWIDQKINQHNPIVPFMVPDARFFHTALVCALKLYNLDPVSLPGVSKAGTAAHGVDDLSLFALCFHDYVHSLVTNRDNVYGAALFDALASAYYAGKDINQFREAYTPVFMNHHKTIEALFRNVLEQHVDGMVNAEKNTDMVKKNTLSESLAGLFLALNEHMGWNRGVYETSSPYKILDVFTAAAKNHLELPDSWVNSPGYP